jgi:hypothetical protein
MTGHGYGRGRGGRADRILNRPPALEAWDPAKPGAYYSRACYAALTPEQKQLNFDTRKSTRKGNRPPAQNAQMAALQTQVSLRSQLLLAPMAHTVPPATAMVL